MTTAPQTTRPETFSVLFRSIVDNIESVIRGKHDVVQLAVLTMIAEGHLLLEDSPGLGKTTLAKAISTTVGGTNGRIQFTPDLLPADVVGMSIWNRGSGEFEFRPGAVFATSCWPTRSTAPHQRLSHRCSRQWQSVRSLSIAQPTISLGPSW